MNRKLTFLVICVLVLAAVGVSLLAYPKLPDRMASHWGASGQVDGWMAKSVCVWIMPIIMAVMSVFFFAILLIDPLRKNIAPFFSYYAGFIIIMNLFLLAVHGWMILWNLEIRIAANVFMPVGVACLIFYAGIVMDHVKPNWFIGIRTPWTLSNELVWQKTNKLAGVLFRIAGIIVLTGAAFPKYAIVFILVPVLTVSIITVLYSIWLGMGGKRPPKKYLSIFFIILLLVCVGAAASAAIHSMLFSTPAFADAVAPLLNAKTVTFRSSSTIQIGDMKVEQSMLCTCQMPSRMRIEMPEENMVVIGEMQTDKILTLMLMPNEKTALKMSIPLPSTTCVNPEDFYTAYFDMRARILQAKENGTAELLPETDMDGRDVIGYRIHETHDDVNSETTIWIDKKTYRLVRTQSIMTFGSCRYSDQETDFEFDKEFSPDYFSLDIPEGYTLIKSPIDLASLKAPDENSLIESLRLCLHYTDGRFPPELTLESVTNLTTEYITNTLIEDSLTSQQEPNGFENNINALTSQSLEIVSGIVFVKTLPEDSDWHYAGKDAVFGEAQTPIFWYRPENSSTYRVIYADLAVKDVSADKVPVVTK